MSITPASGIYALASASGRAGVAVFRISGAAALQALAALGVEKRPEPRLATLVTLRSAARIIDQAIVIYFPTPHSFTGEDVVELHTHGSRAVIRLLLDTLGGIGGLRPAEPGEFARRAFMHGKLDLAQAEGLADLIDAETASQHAQAMRQMGGVTTRRLESLRARVLEPLALLEAYIDFPDEEIPAYILVEAAAQVAALMAEIAALLDDRAIGEKIREGLDIVITGAPNVGKSSLLNCLVQRDAAIVSAEAGTTRDLIEVAMEINGYAVMLVDTAGIRESSAGAVEAEGIRRARHRAAQADITLHLYESATIAAQANNLQAEMGAGALLIATKSDLAPLPPLPFPVLAVSVHSGEGMEALVAALGELVAGRMESAAAPLITRARHRAALAEALACLGRFDPEKPLELNCEELRLTARFIGKITGKIEVDDILDIVFSRFCIGK